MKRFRVKSVTDEHGTEKHYPQRIKLFAFWVDYYITSQVYSLEELSRIREHLEKCKSSKTHVYHKNEPVYFFSFDEAVQFLNFVERTLPVDMAKEGALKELKRNVTIRPVNLE